MVAIANGPETLRTGGAHLAVGTEPICEAIDVCPVPRNAFRPPVVTCGLQFGHCFAMPFYLLSDGNPLYPCKRRKVSVHAKAVGLPDASRASRNATGRKAEHALNQRSCTQLANGAAVGNTLSPEARLELNGDVDLPEIGGPEMVGDDAVGVVAHRGNGMAVTCLY